MKDETDLKEDTSEDMQLSVSFRDHNLMELLFIRSSWGLDTSVTVPDTDPLPPAATLPPQEQERRAWADQWDKQWTGSWEFQVRFDEVLREMGIQAAASQLGPAPRWREALNSAHYDEAAFMQWVSRVPNGEPATLNDSPLTKSDDCVREAWRHGLTKCIVLPYAGQYSRRVGKHILELSGATYWQPDAFEHALSTFWNQD